MSAGLAPGTIPLPGATVTVGDCRCDVLALMVDDAVSGVAVMRDERDLVLLALKDQLRGWGYGSEAVAQVERVATAPIRVLASPDVGLSLYFWLRLGYAPAKEQPCQPNGLVLEKIGRE